MKKIKQFIKKIGNKKLCLLSLLLAGLLIFGVLAGLNGSKTDKTEVHGINTPSIKYLDLNGKRYSYQTSLSELKNSYNIFSHQLQRQFCQIQEDTEGLNNIIVNAFADGPTAVEETQPYYDFLNNTIKFYTNDTNVSPNYSANFETKSFDMLGEEFDLDNITNIQFNFENLSTLGGTVPITPSQYKEGFIISEVFINSDFEGDENAVELRKNTKVISYAFSKAINYNLKIDVVPNYLLRLIIVSFENSQIMESNAINSRVPSEFLTSSSSGYTEDGYIFIDNLKFLNNNNANIIKFDTEYTTGTEYNNGFKYKGNILLSETKYDNLFLTSLKGTLGTTKYTQLFNSGAIFGGNFEENPITSGIQYNTSNYIIGGEYGINVKGDNNSDVLFWYEPAIGTSNWIIHYNKQNRLMYLPNFNGLNTNYNNIEYNALSSQVDDVLYDVKYVGELNEIKNNEKIQDDFLNLVKVVGLGAFLGLLIGFFTGNPIGGLVGGALVGLATSIIPLLIDGIAAIFGDSPFLDSLHELFANIASFFASIVDSLLELLLNLITNPFFLIIILIVAVLYIFVIRKLD